MDRLQTDLEAASDGRDYQLRTSLDVLKRQIEGEIQNEMAVPLQLLNSTEAEHPLCEALRGYRRWIEDRDYENGAESAFENLQAGLDSALDDNWDSVAAWVFSTYIELADNVSDDRRLSEKASEAVDFLEENFDEQDAHGGNITMIVDAISEADIRAVNTDVIERLVDFCWNRSEYCGDSRNHQAQRKHLQRVKKIREQQGKSVDGANNEIVASYDKEVELKRGGGRLVTAAILEEAIVECRDFANEEVLNEWRLEKRRANREGIENEMNEPGVELDSEFVSDFENICDTLVENFAQVSRNNSPEAAFKALISLSNFVPNSEAAAGDGVENKEEFQSANIADIFPKRLMKQEGDSVPEGRSNLNVDRGYSLRSHVYHGILLRVLYRILERDLLQEANLYVLLNSISGATDDDIAFLTDFIRAFFDGRHPEAVHLGLPRLESLARHHLEESGVAVTAEKDGADLPKSLGGLFNLLDEHLDEDYTTFVKYRYTDDLGPEIRNKVAHGNIGYREANFDVSASVLIEVFRLPMRIAEIET